MNLRAIRYFVAAAETENLVRAGASLNVVQSALSQQIRALEKELDVKLFDRAGRRLRLSPVGAVFLEEARRILAQLSHAKDRVDRATLGFDGTLRIGFQPVTCRSEAVCRSLLTFRAHFPGIDLQLTPMAGSELQAAVGEDKYDAGFLYATGSLPKNRHVVLGTTDWLLAMNPTHRLVKKPTISLEDLHQEPFVWLSRAAAPALHDVMLGACKLQGLSPKIVQQTSDENMIINLVSVGMGLAFVIESAAQTWPKGMVRFRKVTDFSLPLPLVLLWANNSQPKPLLHLLDIVSKATKR